MRAIVVLADSAQLGPDGKVHALGMGWTTTVTPTPPAAVCVFIYIPWTATNVRHQFALELIDGDGQKAVAPDDSPLRIEGEFEMGRPPGAVPGAEAIQPFVANVPPGLDLTAGQRYSWQIHLDGHHEEDWSATFHVGQQMQVGPKP